MAAVMVVSDDGGAVVDIVQDQVDGVTEGRCRACSEHITDRGGYEDTIAAAVVHVDHRH